MMSTFYLSVYEEGGLKHTFTVPEIGTLLLPGIIISKYFCHYRMCLITINSSETGAEPICSIDYDKLHSPISLVKGIKTAFCDGNLVLLFDERELPDASSSHDSRNESGKNTDNVANEEVCQPESAKCEEKYIEYCGAVLDKLSFARENVSSISLAIGQLGEDIKKLQKDVQTDLNTLSEHLSPDMELFVSPIRYLDELIRETISPKSSESTEWRDIHESLLCIRSDLKSACAELGIQEFWPESGDAYSPLYHSSNEIPEGKGVLFVKRRLYCGFRTGDRILRKAEVVLERGEDE